MSAVQVAEFPSVAPVAAPAERVDAALLPTRFLDAIRGLAALYVVFTHARIYLVISAASVLATKGNTPLRAEMAALLATRYGHAAVMAFFLISGYAIHYRQAFRLAANEDHIISWRSFAIHRARRIYPPLIVAVLLTFIFEASAYAINPAFFAGQSPDPDFGFMHRSSPVSYVGSLLFVQGILVPVLTFNGALWSLAYEAFYYATYPLVLAMDRRFGPGRCLLLFLAVAAIAGFLHRAHPEYGFLVVIAYWPIWVAGAWIADVRAGRARASRTVVNVAAVGGLVGAAALALALIVTKHPANDLHMDPVWASLWLGPLTWLAACQHSSAVRIRLTQIAAPLMDLGAISYSLYVVHFPVVTFLCAAWLGFHATLPTTPALFLLGVAAALLVTLPVYAFAERPFLRRSAEKLHRPA